MGFSVFVEAINLRVRGKGKPVQFHEPYVGGAPPSSGTKAPKRAS
jgi:hypothetical protein